MNIYFLLLSAFKYTGGLEKFNRAFIKALYDISSEQNFELVVKSSHDLNCDNRYLPDEKFQGFNKNKIKFTINCLAESHKIDIAFIGHINLAPVALLLKLLNPKIKLILIGHGIEIWDKQILFKKILLKWVHKILAVSNFTKNQIVINNEVKPDKIIIFPNTLDPYFVTPVVNKKPQYLLERYNIDAKTKIVLTVSRLTKYEGYKGYDKVIEALPKVIKKVPDIKYLLCGKYDEAEGTRLKEKVKNLDVEQYFTLTGFIKEEELTDHYLLADVFVLPSKKEGFGIVFIEAVACGIPVIAGNQDGSVDALLNGELGKLINPDSVEEISEAIISQLNKDKVNNSNKVIENFGFRKFKEKLNQVINTI